MAKFKIEVSHLSHISRGRFFAPVYGKGGRLAYKLCADVAFVGAVLHKQKLRQDRDGKGRPRRMVWTFRDEIVIDINGEYSVDGWTWSARAGKGFTIADSEDGWGSPARAAWAALRNLRSDPQEASCWSGPLSAMKRA